MPRIRYIKPDFFTDGDIAALPPLTRILFEGLWCHSDREGILEDKPKELKVKILPYDVYDIDKGLSELEGDNENEKVFIRRYKVQNKKYIIILNFHLHQKPHHTEKPSTFPGPEKADINEEASQDPKKENFIKELFDIFCDAYNESRSAEFEQITAGKEIKAIAKILNLYKQKNPKANTDEAREDFKKLFKKCLAIKETWHYNNMSPSHILSQFNQIKLILNGKNQKPGTQGRGTTSQELQDIVSGKFDGALNLQR